MSKTYKTDPWDVQEARESRRERSRHTRDLSKRIRARERREMERITHDLEAWESYYPTGATLHEFETTTNRNGWNDYVKGALSTMCVEDIIRRIN